MDSMIRRIWALKHKKVSIINVYIFSLLKILSGNTKYISNNRTFIYQPGTLKFLFLGSLLILVPEIYLEKEDKWISFETDFSHDSSTPL